MIRKPHTFSPSSSCLPESLVAVIKAGFADGELGRVVLDGETRNSDPQTINPTLYDLCLTSYNPTP
jgi:hypothetical protein